MARTSVKSTYSLDVETVGLLEKIARRWSVSKSEALRRAIKAASEKSVGKSTSIRVLDELQQAVNLKEVDGKAWAERSSSERKVTSRRRETETR